MFSDAIAKSFSITHNWTDLFKVNKNEIRVLHGMRVITATLVIGSHQVLLSLSVPSMLINTLEIDTVTQLRFIVKPLNNVRQIVIPRDDDV